MDFLKRAVSLPEKFYFEVNIHSIQVHLPLECFIQVVVKRSQKKKEKTPKYPYDPSSPLTHFDTTLTFPVTLYKSGSSYNTKNYFFRMVQLTKKKSIKNGKACFNISDLVRASNSNLSLPLKNCSDRNASISLTLSLSRILKTESLGFNLKPPDIISPERTSKSFDHSPIKKNTEHEKQIKKEKYLRRIQKVNSFHGSPMSATLLIDSDVSSCASPASPFKYPESPEKEEIFSIGFEIKPIKIELEEEEEEEEGNDRKLDIGGKENEWIKFVKEEDSITGQFNERISEVSEDSGKDEWDEKDVGLSNDEYVNDLPKGEYKEAEPGSKTNYVIGSVDINDENSNSKCCKCRIV